MSVYTCTLTWDASRSSSLVHTNTEKTSIISTAVGLCMHLATGIVAKLDSQIATKANTTTGVDKRQVTRVIKIELADE